MQLLIYRHDGETTSFFKEDHTLPYKVTFSETVADFFFALNIFGRLFSVLGTVSA